LVDRPSLSAHGVNGTALFLRPDKPLLRLGVVPWHAKAKLSHPTEFVLGVGVTLKGRYRKTAFAAGVERFAQVDRAFAVTADHWHRDPMLLGTPGATVDLRTGKLRPADPDDAISKVTLVAPAETTDCPRFLAFLNEATGCDPEQIRFLQQFCGYCLTDRRRNTP
jgi:hypothetical protein